VMMRQTGGSLGVAAFGALFAGRMAAGMGEGSGLPVGEGTNFGPQMLAKLTPEQQQTIGETVVNAIHPVYLIAAILAAIGLVFAFVLKEVPLTNRHVPRGE
jgi:hypothetical protein